MRLVLCAVCLFLVSFLPTPARSQTYTSTGSAISYNPNTNLVTVESAWYYQTSGSTYWWFSSVSFDIEISTYTSWENYNTGNAQSTSTSNYGTSPGGFSFGAYSPGVGRVYGYRTFQLGDGYLYSVRLVNPKTGNSSYQLYPNAPVWFSWSGQSQSPITVDRLHPGDGE